ncbi:uncharacterized protein LOC131592857 [Poecile atricapillus]|uniref:uncharacterized protein LOC131592857 n=1 Tax=Poecile atricapillus TaxID=48891 RepID=UPI002738890C|nr:uncharacterized protein LOC131592857 [Poecile atricapillus]
MENPAFEMHGATPPAFSRSKEELQSKGKSSTMKFFLLCLLASIITTSLGILILSLIFGNCREFPKDSGGNEEFGKEMEEKTDPKFRFLYHLKESKIYKYQGGEIQWARFRRDPREYENPEVREFGKSLNFHKSQITLGMLRIRSRGLRAPHWHFNANEHGFLLQGSAWIGILGPDHSQAVTYNVTEGQVVFFPKNSVHWVKNVGKEDLIFLLFFSTHEELLTLDVDDVFFSTPEDVAARALKPKGGVGFIRTFQKPEEDQTINLPKNLDQLIHNSTFPQSPDSQVWKFFYDLPGSPEFPFPGGIFRWARFRKNGTGLTENQRIFSQSLHEHENSLTLATLRIFGNHLGIPHFHFNANEMGVVISGCGQVGVVLPEGSSLFSVGIGDVIFFPLGSQHFIQSFCQEDLLLVLAYNTGNQLETLRMNQYFPGISHQILAQLFHKNQEEFQKIPKNSR